MTINPVASDVDRDRTADAVCLPASTSHRTWRAMPVNSTPPQHDSFALDFATRRRNYRPMTVGGEVAFAWALAGVTEGMFSRRERAWICVTLGAGDSPRAVVARMLDAIVTHGLVLSDELADSAFDWLMGFIGTEDEPRLRGLVERASSRPPR
jgi:hypothetical protein